MDLTNRELYLAWLWCLTKMPDRQEIRDLVRLEYTLERDVVRIKARWRLARMIGTVAELSEMLDALGLWPAPAEMSRQSVPRPTFNSRRELERKQ